MKLVLLGDVLEGTCVFFFEETFCELTWFYGMSWVFRKEDTAGIMFANMVVFFLTLWCRGTSGLKLRQLTPVV